MNGPNGATPEPGFNPPDAANYNSIGWAVHYLGRAIVELSEKPNLATVDRCIELGHALATLGQAVMLMNQINAAQAAASAVVLPPDLQRKLRGG